MRAKYWALSREYWGEERAALMMWLLAISALTMLMYAGRVQHERMAPIEDNFHVIMHCIFMICFFPGMGIVCAAANGCSSRRFSLPVSTRTLTALPMLNAAVVGVGTYLLASTLLDVMFHVNWPLLKPALVTASVMIWTAGAVMAGGRFGMARILLAFAVTTAVSAWHVRLMVGTHFFLDKFDYWQRLSSAELFFWGVATALPFLFLPPVVARYRRGDSLLPKALWSSFVDWQSGLRRLSTFNSPTAAQGWLEWTSRGIATPVSTAALALLGLIITWFAGNRQAMEMWHALSILGFQAAFVFGIYLGMPSPRMDLDSFKATLPLSDTQIADSVLWNIARAVLSSMAVWCAALLGATILMLVHENTVQKNWQWLTQSWDRCGMSTLPVAVALPLGLAIFALAVWSVMSLGATLAMLRQKGLLVFFALLLFTPILFWLCLRLFVPTTFHHQYSIVAKQAFIIGLVTATLLMHLVTWRKNLVTAWRAILSFLVPLLPGGLFLLCVPEFRSHLGAWELLLVLTSLLSLPFSGAPLAIWWNRHR